MVVFVNLPFTLIKLDKAPREVCQLVAHEEDELHNFAKLLGLTKKDFVDCSVPHYLLSKNLRQEAFNLGAKSAALQDLRQITSLRKRQLQQSNIQKEVKKRGGRKKKNVTV
jgi:hypothetical protein